MLVAGLEPARPCERGILSPLRLPFRHTSMMEVPPGFEPGNEGFADPCLTAWLWYHFLQDYFNKRKINCQRIIQLFYMKIVFISLKLLLKV